MAKRSRKTSDVKVDFIFTFSWIRFLICLVLLATTVGAYFVCAYIFHWDDTSGDIDGLVFHTVDVGAGDCLVVEFPDDKVMMVDTGYSYQYNKVKTYLQDLSITRIDWFVSTHADADHTGGLTNLLDDFTVTTVFASPCTENYNASVYQSLRADGRLAIPGYMETITRSEYTITFVCPRESDDPGLTTTNAGSLMLTIEYYNKIFVLTGDATGATEDIFRANATKIFQSKNDKQIILKVAHHGANTNGSNGEAFLDFVFSGNTGNNYALISCKKDDPSHPAPKTMERLQMYCASDHIYQTADLGTIVVQASAVALAINGVTQPFAYWWIFVAVGGVIVLLCFLDFGASRQKRR